MQEIIEKVKKVLMQMFNIKQEEHIQLHTKLKDGLGLDSMSSLTFLMALEDSIEGFVVDPDTLDNQDLLNVETISRYVHNQLERKIKDVA